MTEFFIFCAILLCSGILIVSYLLYKDANEAIHYAESALDKAKNYMKDNQEVLNEMKIIANEMEEKYFNGKAD